MKYDANHTFQQMQVGIVAEIHAILTVMKLVLERVCSTYYLLPRTSIHHNSLRQEFA